MPPAADGDGPGTRTVVASLVVVVFLTGAGAGVAFPTLPTLGGVLGITPLVVGVILSTNRFARLVLNAPVGGLVDAVGTRRPMVVGLFLIGLAPLGYVLGLHASTVPVLDAPGVFVLARLLQGVGSALLFVGAFTTIVHVTSSADRGRWLGYMRGGQSLGLPAGLVMGGVLTDQWSYEVAFTAAGALGLVAGVVGLAVLPNTTGGVDQQSRLRDVPAMLRRDPRILAIGTVHFVVRLLFAGVLLSTVVLYAAANGIELAGFSAIGVSGVLLAVSVLALGAATLVSGRLSDAVDNRALVALPALGLFGLCFGLLGLLPTLPATLVGVAGIGLGVGGTNPPLLAFLGDVSPAGDVGKLGGVYNVFGDLGATVGPVVALTAAAVVGYRVVYLASAALVGLVALLVVGTLLGGDPTRGPVDAASATAADDAPAEEAPD